MFFPVQPDLFFTKNDSEDIRLGDLAQHFDDAKCKPCDFVIFGYPDDEGIKLNGGRTGAQLAPRQIRQFLYKMTLSAKKPLFKSQIFDYGDLALSTPDLGLRHNIVHSHVLKTYSSQLKIISFGGGHDYGYPDCAGFIDAYFNTHKQKPIILNFDAHMDVRPTQNGPNSGTPFYRLHESHLNQFNLIEIGIQNQCNSPHHIRWAKDRNVEVVDLDTLNEQGWNYLWTKTVLSEIDSQRPVFVSFDIDALQASDAGGCSQAWATGLKLQDCLNFLKQLYQKTSVKGLGIYEVSPPLDRDFQTSKTAALLAHHFIFNNS